MDIQQIDESSDNESNTDSQHDHGNPPPPPSKSLTGYENEIQTESNEERNKISMESLNETHIEAPQKLSGAYEDIRVPAASIPLSHTQTATSVSVISNSQVEPVVCTISVPEKCNNWKDLITCVQPDKTCINEDSSPLTNTTNPLIARSLIEPKKNTELYLPCSENKQNPNAKRSKNH